MRWVVLGDIPKRINSKAEKAKYQSVIEKIGYENLNDIVFHSWSHFFCSRMVDVIPDKRIVVALSGHKTSAMLDHYAKHLEDERTLW